MKIVRKEYRIDVTQKPEMILRDVNKILRNLFKKYPKHIHGWGIDAETEMLTVGVVE